MHAGLTLLLWPAIQPSTVDLALAEPPPQQVLIHVLQRPCDSEGDNAAEHLPRVRLCTRNGAKAPIKVAARDYKRDSAGNVYRVEPPEKRKGTQRTVREARVDLAPSISRKRTVALLESGNERNSNAGVGEVEPAAERQELKRTQRVEQV